MGGPAVSAAMGSFYRPRPWGHTLLALLLLLMCAAVCGDEDWAEEQAAGDWDEEEDWAEDHDLFFPAEADVAADAEAQAAVDAGSVAVAAATPAPAPAPAPAPTPAPAPAAATPRQDAPSPEQEEVPFEPLSAMELAASPPTPDRHRQSPTYTNMRPGYYHPVAASLYNFVPDKGYGQPFIAVSSFQKHGEGQMSSEVVSDASRAWWWSADFQLWAASTPTPSTELSSIPSAAASTPIESEAVHAYERATGDSDGQSGGRPLLVPSARWRSAACVVWRGGAAEAPA